MTRIRTTSNTSVYIIFNFVQLLLFFFSVSWDPVSNPEQLSPIFYSLFFLTSLAVLSGVFLYDLTPKRFIIGAGIISLLNLSLVILDTGYVSQAEFEEFDLLVCFDNENKPEHVKGGFWNFNLDWSHNLTCIQRTQKIHGRLGVASYTATFSLSLKEEVLWSRYLFNNTVDWREVLSAKLLNHCLDAIQHETTYEVKKISIIGQPGYYHNIFTGRSIEVGRGKLLFTEKVYSSCDATDFGFTWQSLEISR